MSVYSYTENDWNKATKVVFRLPATIRFLAHSD